jgi:hypothetical protein
MPDWSRESAGNEVMRRNQSFDVAAKFDCARLKAAAPGGGLEMRRTRPLVGVMPPSRCLTLRDGPRWLHHCTKSDDDRSNNRPAQD